MSPTPIKRNALPAAMIALAVSAGAPAAQAGAHAQRLDIGFFSEQQTSFGALAGDEAAGLRDWLTSLRGDIDITAQAVTDMQATVADRLAVLNTGIAALDRWTVERTATIVALVADIGATAAQLARAEPAYGDVAATALAASDAIQTSLDSSLPQAGAQLTGLGLRLAGPLPGETAEAGVETALWPIYAALDQAFGQSRRLVTAMDWSRLDRAFAAAKATEPVSDKGIARFTALEASFAQLKTIAARGAELVVAAREEVLRVVAETTRLAIAAQPADSDAIDARPAGGEEASLVPAADDETAIRPFGRRVDYLGMARRWIGEP